MFVHTVIHSGSKTGGQGSLGYIARTRVNLNCMKHCLKENVCGAGERAKWLRALVALPEHADPIPSTHMAVHNHLKLWS